MHLFPKYLTKMEFKLYNIYHFCWNKEDFLLKKKISSILDQQPMFKVNLIKFIVNLNFTFTSLNLHR